MTIQPALPSARHWRVSRAVHSRFLTANASRPYKGPPGAKRRKTTGKYATVYGRTASAHRPRHLTGGNDVMCASGWRWVS